ncbi:MAG: hypothetical protein KAI17_03805 [Thiotrichaceae bacterium]|nr:hypothetical protein [Thiotrichaceae bacterium]
MLQLILGLNTIIMFLFWLACWVAITPAYNNFIQYGETGSILPYLTQLAIDVRVFLLFIPVLWIVISFLVFKTIRKKQNETRLQFLLFFIMLSISSGFLMLIFYGIAGILPYLKIGVTL